MSSTPTPSNVEPFFFGGASRQLYGCYHEPPSWPAREVGIVLCYPQGQEYIRSHRAFNQMALHMARAGFPVLRFDYFGTGDSASDASAATFDGWLADVRLAAAELRARSGVDAVVLAGLRLGATLALLAAPTAGDVVGLVLWDPVIDGARYLDELRDLHEAAINRFFVRPKEYVVTARPAELLGFAMPESLRTGVEKTDLLQTAPLRNMPLVLLESQGAPETAALAAHLETAARVTHEIIPSFTVWVEDVDKGLVPQPLIEAIVMWLEATYP